MPWAKTKRLEEIAETKKQILVARQNIEAILGAEEKKQDEMKNREKQI